MTMVLLFIMQKLHFSAFKNTIMKNKVLLFIYILISNILSPNCLFAQNDSEVKLDLLKAPASPAANLLKFATTDIEKPTDLSALMLSLQSASSSLTKLPSNYAIDIAPYWLLRTRTDFTTTGLNKTNYKDVFRQTFVLSLGVKNVDSVIDNFKPTSTYGSIGFKFSIMRPKYNKENIAVLEKIHEKQKELNLAVYKFINKKNDEYKKLVSEYTLMIVALKQQFIDDVSFAKELKKQQENSSSEISKNEKSREELNQSTIDKVLEEKNGLIDELSTTAKEFDGKREGFSWDIAGGVSSEFRSKRFNNSKVHNAGIWTTIGFNGKKNLSFLMLVRYLLNPEQDYIDKATILQNGNISTIDGGGRLIYATAKSKFNTSLEFLYRQAFTSFSNDKTWRLIFNADYAIWQNQKLTFSFGRAFDGAITKDGNLVAALTFLTGFGNKR